MGLDHLDQIRRQLGRTGGGEEAVASGAVKKVIDNFVTSANSSYLSNGSTKAINLLKQGRVQYAKASRFEDISDIITKADGDPNKIKSGLTSFLKNSDNLHGFSPIEIDALKQAARSTAPEKILKGFGKFGIDLGTS